MTYDPDYDDEVKIIKASEIVLKKLPIRITRVLENNPTKFGRGTLYHFEYVGVENKIRKGFFNENLRRFNIEEGQVFYLIAGKNSKGGLAYLPDFNRTNR